MEQLLNKVLADKRARIRQAEKTGTVPSNSEGTSLQRSEEAVVIPYDELSADMRNQLQTPSSSGVYNQLLTSDHEMLPNLLMPSVEVGIHAANVAALNNLTAIRSSLNARRRVISESESDAMSFELRESSYAEIGVGTDDLMYFWVCSHCGHRSNAPSTSTRNVMQQIDDVAQTTSDGAAGFGLPSLFDAGISESYDQRKAAIFDNVMQIGVGEVKPAPKTKPLGAVVDFTIIKGRELYAESAPVGYVGDRHVDKMIAKYSSLDSYVDQDGNILVYAQCVNYGDQLNKRRSNGKFQTMYDGPRNKLSFAKSNGKELTSLLMKGILLGMVVASHNSVPTPNVWTSYRGTRNVVNVSKMQAKEYELLRILNQPYPYTEEKYVWHNVNIPMSNLNVGRPKGNLISVANYWTTFLNLVEKIGLVGEMCEVMTDTLGLCEYLAAIKATFVSISGLSDGSGEITYHPQGTDTLVTYNIKDMLVASVVMGDELLLIHTKSGKLTRHVDQWNALFRRSILQVRGVPIRQATSISYAILGQDGYDRCVMPGTVHCSNVFNDKMLAWLGDIADNIEESKVFNNKVYKNTSRATFFLDTAHMAMAHGYTDFAHMIKDGCYKAMIFYDQEKGLLHRLAGGTEIIVIIEIPSRIVVLSEFGRHRYRLQAKQLKAFDNIRVRLPGVFD